MKRVLLLIAAFASPLLARPADPPLAICPEPVKPQLFLSPIGEAFRPTGDGDDPVRRWFDQADRDRDGKLTIGEVMLDADRFFMQLDQNRDGELLPDEVHGYEDLVPEIRLYQARPEAKPGEKGERSERARPPTAKPRPGVSAYDGAMGAGRYAFLNIPNPVAAADSDINRAVTAKEFRAAAAERFRDLDPKQTKALAFGQLAKTPAQVTANAACLARIAQLAKERRR